MSCCFQFTCRFAVLSVHLSLQLLCLELALLDFLDRRPERIHCLNIEHHMTLRALSRSQDALGDVIADGLRVDAVDICYLTSGEEDSLAGFLCTLFHIT